MEILKQFKKFNCLSVDIYFLTIELKLSEGKMHIV